MKLTPDRSREVQPPTRDARPRWLAMGITVVVGLLLAAVSVWPQLSARATGTTMTFAVQPIDPLDPFRGAYVSLDYPDLPLSADDIGDPTLGTDEPPLEGTFYLPVSRQGELWVGASPVATRPSSGRYLTCHGDGYRLHCGIEDYFLPQDKAADLQNAINEGTMRATVKVDGRGNAALIRVGP